MARGKKHSPEQVVNLLRQIEVAVANGKPNLKQPQRARPIPTSKLVEASDLPLLRPIIRTLWERTIVSIRDECPGWDIYALQHDFDEWINAGPSRTPDNYEAAFQGWVRKHHARNRSQLSGSRS